MTFASPFAFLLLFCCLASGIAFQPRRGLKQESNTSAADQELLIAVADSDLERIKLLLKPQPKGAPPAADVNAKNSVGSTPLMLSVIGRNAPVFDVLVSGGAEVDLQNVDGFTALHFAAQEGLSFFVKRLLENSADIEIQTMRGATPLYIAAQNGREGATEALLLGGANPETEFQTGATPLLAAAQHASLGVVKLLVSSGADIAHMNENEVSAMHFAAFHANGSSVVRFLAQNNLPVDVHDMWKDTPLDYAAFYGNLKVVQTLLDLGADSQAQDSRNGLPFDSICKCQEVAPRPGRIPCPAGNCNDAGKDKLSRLLKPATMVEETSVPEQADLESEYLEVDSAPVTDRMAQTPSGIGQPAPAPHDMDEAPLAPSKRPLFFVSGCCQDCPGFLAQDMNTAECLSESTIDTRRTCMENIANRCFSRPCHFLSDCKYLFEADCLKAFMEIEETCPAESTCWNSVVELLGGEPGNDYV